MYQDFTDDGGGEGADVMNIIGILTGTEKAWTGFKAGDVITAMSGDAIKSLKDLSDLLKGLSAGDKVDIELLKDGIPIYLDAVLKER